MSLLAAALPSRQIIAANGTMPLQGPTALWEVESGSVAVFFAADGQTPVQAGHFLFNVSAGEILFSATCPELQHGTISAVALVSTTLRLIQRYDANSNSTTAGVPAAALMNWAHKLASMLPLGTPVGSSIDSGTPAVILSPGQTFLPEENDLIVRIHAGRVRWLGLPDTEIESAVILLAGSMWLQAVTAAEISTSAISSDPEKQTPDFISALSRLQDCILRWMCAQAETEPSERARRVARRRNSYDAAVEESFADLTAAAEPETRQRKAFPGEPLLVCIHILAKAVGVGDPALVRSRDQNIAQDPVDAAWQIARIRLRRILLTAEWWRDDCGPLLGFRHENNPVALLPDRSGYHIVDPATGTRSTVDADAAVELVPVAYAVHEPLPENLTSLRSLLNFGFRQQKRTIALLLIVGTLTTLLGMLFPLATAVLIDTAIPDANFNVLRQIALGLLFAAFGTVLFQVVEVFSTTRLETAATGRTQAALWDRLLRLPPSFFRLYSVGELSLRVMTAARVRERLGATTLKTIFVSFISLLNFALMFYYDPWLAITAGAFGLLAALVLTIGGLLASGKCRLLQQIEGKLFGTTLQLMHGISKLRVAGAEKAGFAYWAHQCADQQRLAADVQTYRDWIQTFNETMPIFASVAILAMAAGAVTGQSHTALTLGGFLSFYTAFGVFLGAIKDLGNTVIDVREISNFWQRTTPILTASPEVTHTAAEPGVISGDVCFDHVKFRYRKSGPLVLDDISFHAAPGEFITLVGPSGSGKSTIFRLLLAFETPESGAIYYNGQDLSGLDVHRVRQQLGTVMQNNRILSASIFDNIAAGASITLEEAWRAVRLAGLEKDLSSMPMGMFTFISEGGTNLSGGQKQRLFLARALARQPKVLLLDEATSALDNVTQSIVTESLENMHITRIVIAHRLSTIRKADRIYVIGAGRIVESGTFDQLAAQAGLFSRLMTRQLL